MDCCSLSVCPKCRKFTLHSHITLISGKLTDRFFCNDCGFKSSSKFRGEQLVTG